MSGWPLRIALEHISDLRGLGRFVDAGLAANIETPKMLSASSALQTSEASAQKTVDASPIWMRCLLSLEESVERRRVCKSHGLRDWRIIALLMPVGHKGVLVEGDDGRA